MRMHEAGDEFNFGTERLIVSEYSAYAAVVDPEGSTPTPVVLLNLTVLASEDLAPTNLSLIMEASGVSEMIVALENSLAMLKSMGH